MNVDIYNYVYEDSESFKLLLLIEKIVDQPSAMIFLGVASEFD